jgi:hypothetical protein
MQNHGFGCGGAALSRVCKIRILRNPVAVGSPLAGASEARASSLADEYRFSKSALGNAGSTDGIVELPKFEILPALGFRTPDPQ